VQDPSKNTTTTEEHKCPSWQGTSRCPLLFLLQFDLIGQLFFLLPSCNLFDGFGLLTSHLGKLLFFSLLISFLLVLPFFFFCSIATSVSCNMASIESSFRGCLYMLIYCYRVMSSIDSSSGRIPHFLATKSLANLRIDFPFELLALSLGLYL
jgi:hypothetical protein